MYTLETVLNFEVIPVVWGGFVFCTFTVEKLSIT